MDYSQSKEGQIRQEAFLSLLLPSPSHKPESRLRPAAYLSPNFQYFATFLVIFSVIYCYDDMMRLYDDDDCFGEDMIACRALV